MEIWQNLSFNDLEGEIWSPIDGYEFSYEISNMGRVKSLGKYVQHGKNKLTFHPSFIRKIQKCSNGYLFIILCKESKTKMKLVHRLVAKAFIPNPENKPQVNHKEGNKKDNRATELEWATKSEDNIHRYRYLKIPPVRNKGISGNDNNRSKKVLCTNNNITYESAGDAARKLNTHQSNISRICRNESTHYKGLNFKYII